MKKVRKYYPLLAVLVLLTVVVPAQALQMWRCEFDFTLNYQSECKLCGKSREDGMTLKSIKPRDHLFFGHFPQTAEGNDSTPIEWLVLDVQDGKALLLSWYGLDANRFDHGRNANGWARSEIRSWLNSTFLNNAFTAEEQEKIVAITISTPGKSGDTDTKDRIWLLSSDEASHYFEKDEDRKAAPTKYAVAQGAFQHSSGSCWWWLRSSGNIGGSAYFISHDGSLNRRN